MTYRLNIHDPNGKEMFASEGRKEYYAWFNRAYFAMPGLEILRNDPNWDSTRAFEECYGVRTGPAGLTFEGGSRKRRFEYVEFDSEAEAVLFLMKF
jgi:hypothetical protein